MRPTKELLDKYLEGKCTEQEARLVESWLAEDRFADAWPPAPGEEAAQEQVWQQMQPRGPSRYLSWQTGRWLGGIAASVLLAMGFLFWFKPQQSRPVSAVVKTAPPVTQTILNAPAGRRRSWTLPDGTVAYLNAGSQLRYRHAFDRTVELEGEAFFEVARDTLRPFTITTRRTRTTVLGTKFNLKAYAGDKTEELVVKEGKVRFADRSTDAEHLILTANMKGTFRPGKAMDQTQVYAANSYAWRENKLIFQDEKLSEIVPVLERWYNVRIEVRSPALRELRYIGSFQNVSLQQVMAGMSYALDFKYELNDHQLTIY